MPDDTQAPSPTAVALVVSTPQPDDSGADTADRYDWQAAMAAAHGLRLLYDVLSKGSLDDGPFCRIICELHEDWVTCIDDDAELISAKHRERSFGAYTTVNMLVNQGGCGHLFGRWCALHEKPTCRVVTTAGLKGKAKNLIDTCQTLRSQRLNKVPFNVDSNQRAVIDDFVKCLLGYKPGEHESGLPTEWTGATGNPIEEPTQTHTAQAMRFLAILEIDCDPPLRTEIGHAAPSMYVGPVLRVMGYEEERSSEIWNAVLGLFRERMRAAGPTPDGSLPRLMQWRPTKTGQIANTESNLCARIVPIPDIAIAIEIAVMSITEPFSTPPPLPPSRLGLKMAKGGCSDNSVERAEQLRLDYRAYWRTSQEVDHSARFEHDSLRRLLLRISDEATASVMVPGEIWGAQFWTEIQSRIKALREDLLPARMDKELALGGICDLSSQCQVWFSERFDIETAMLHAQQGQVA
ncbi:hypothetical protein [Actinocatenispora thailandica]|uniref:hypothetical protein n=1 Tax=Actinocatenispora thailandica TaxID=227318 RepID=UPI0019503D1C|nr:hypothetical protein [Actinocatenispora thailandica]